MVAGWLAHQREQEALEAPTHQARALEASAWAARWRQARAEFQMAVHDAGVMASEAGPGTGPVGEAVLLDRYRRILAGVEAEVTETRRIMEVEVGPAAGAGPADSDSEAEGERMVAELHRRMRASAANDHQLELLEQSLVVELMDQRGLHTDAERVEFRRRLIAHMNQRQDAFRTPSDSEQSS